MIMNKFYVKISVLFLVLFFSGPIFCITIESGSPSRTNQARPYIIINGIGATPSGMVQMIVNNQDIPQATPSADFSGNFSVGSLPAFDLTANASNTIKVKDISSNLTSDPGFEIFYDNTNPSMISFLASPDPVDIGTITISITFDETMNTSVNPDVSITTATGQTLTADQESLWNTIGTIYTVSALIKMDTGEGNALVNVSNARDLAGNSYSSVGSAGSFVVDIDLTPANLSPANPYFTDDITITPQKSDQEYRWYKNNLFIPGQTNYVLPSTFIQEKDVIRGEIRFITGDTKTSPLLTVLSSLPTGLKALTNPGGNIELSWSASPNPDITKVLIFSDNGTGTINLAAPVASVPVPLTSHTFENLKENIAYKFALGVADNLNQTEEPLVNESNFVSGTPDKTPPVVKCISPEEECKSRYPSLVFKVTDNVTGIDLSSILLRLDGMAVPHSYNSSESLVYYPVSMKLSQGSHTASITLNDKIGNKSVFTRYFNIREDKKFISYDIYPNPCRGVEQIFRYELAEIPDIGQIKIYDARERLIRSIDPFLYTGYNESSWDLTSDDGQYVPNGTYFIVFKFVFDNGLEEKAVLKASILR